MVRIRIHNRVSVNINYVLSRDVKLDFFSKSKLKSKKLIKTRNSFPVRMGRVAVAEHPVAWWVDCGGPRAMVVSLVSRRVRHVGQSTLGM